MAAQLERLKYIGSYGLDCQIEFDILEVDFGDGYDDSSLVGSSEGTRSWMLVFKVLPLTLDGAIEVPSQIDLNMMQSRADYLWGFFCRRKAEGNSSFILKCPKDNKLYLVKFIDHRLTYNHFMSRLFSSSLGIMQRRELGVSVDADGSRGEDTGNPAII